MGGRKGGRPIIAEWTDGRTEGLFKNLAGNFLLLSLIIRQLHFWLDTAIEKGDAEEEQCQCGRGAKAAGIRHNLFSSANPCSKNRNFKIQCVKKGLRELSLEASVIEKWVSRNPSCRYTKLEEWLHK